MVGRTRPARPPICIGGPTNPKPRPNPIWVNNDAVAGAMSPLMPTGASAPGDLATLNQNHHRALHLSMGGNRLSLDRGVFG